MCFPLRRPTRTSLRKRIKANTNNGADVVEGWHLRELVGLSAAAPIEEGITET